MKKLATILMIALGIGFMLSSCGGSKTTPEEEVRNYGNYFIEKVKTNQIDSLKASYPAIADADSITPIVADSVIVTPSATPGEFDLALGEDVKLKVRRSEDGKIDVVESRGLFAYPPQKVEVAIKTGLWNDNLSDVQLNDRMKDEEFFAWVEKNKSIKSGDIINVGKTINDGGSGDASDPNRCHVILTNKTNVPINGSDYKIKYEFWNSYAEHNPTYNYEKGKDIPANGTVRIEWSYGGETEYYLKGITWNLSQEQLKEKFASYSGNEYQEYLDSKK